MSRATTVTSYSDVSKANKGIKPATFVASKSQAAKSIMHATATKSTANSDVVAVALTETSAYLFPASIVIARIDLSASPNLPAKCQKMTLT